MASMARVPPLITAAILAIVALGVLFPDGGRSAVRVRLAGWRRQIVPGSIGRTSLALDATYRANLKLTWATRAIWVDSTATIRNTSGGPIDRIELNTIAARLGEIRCGR